jgi:hypothetical protein
MAYINSETALAHAKQKVVGIVPLWSFVSFVVKKVALKSIQPDGVLACVAGF